MAESGHKRNIPIKLGDFSVIDTEFSSIRERFDAEMRKMEEEMSKFRSELMNRESNNFFKSTTRSPSSLCEPSSKSVGGPSPLRDVALPAGAVSQRGAAGRRGRPRDAALGESIQKPLFGGAPRNDIGCRHLDRFHLKRAAIRRHVGTRRRPRLAPAPAVHSPGVGSGAYFTKCMQRQLDRFLQRVLFVGKMSWL
ncbi:hypothetical protein EVAR_56650_1 [Eumeta japonica]|uniref:Uncharacterized protein n=1 Tax=Eumeta variegata TaxID=151549 RepID=A0A4C1YXG4_EUMVA|nr:hypothetical protein EVAR_56650_1 [Eumeta japonica]